MDVEQLKDDVRNGRISVDRLIELILMLQRQLDKAQQRRDCLAQGPLLSLSPL